MDRTSVERGDVAMTDKSAEMRELLRKAFECIQMLHERVRALEEEVEGDNFDSEAYCNLWMTISDLADEADPGDDEHAP